MKNKFRKNSAVDLGLQRALCDGKISEVLSET